MFLRHKKPAAISRYRLKSEFISKLWILLKKQSDQNECSIKLDKKSFPIKKSECTMFFLQKNIRLRAFAEKICN